MPNGARVSNFMPTTVEHTHHTQGSVLIGERARSEGSITDRARVHMSVPDRTHLLVLALTFKTSKRKSWCVCVCMCVRAYGRVLILFLQFYAASDAMPLIVTAECV